VNPAEAAAFAEGMTSLTSTVAEETARVIDTSGVNIVADVGGARGAMLYALLRIHPHLQGIVFDRPNVIASASAAAGEFGLQERVTTVGGDFFQCVPGADLYLLKHILHDWDDAACICILRNCRRALRPGGRVAVIELLLGEIEEPSLAPIFDVTMMVMSSGRERSLVEYKRMFEAAGLRATNVIPTKTPMTILEAVAG
jgi:hypothetical protein